MLKRSTIQLLRFHFSMFLLPVFLFALSQIPHIDWKSTVLVFTILHLLVYPSSNGYNSYMDRDDSSIGGLARPLQPTRQLFYVSVIMDVAALTLSLLVSIYFAVGVGLYILASRAYSYRGIRLKKFPITGYLVVIFFQGAMTFFLAYHGCSQNKILEAPLIPMLAASFLIGGYYPLTQVYQHEDDRKDGVQTISMLLGKRGTFVFCGLVFLLATVCMFLTFYHSDINRFWIFLACMLPVLLFFNWWAVSVWKNGDRANFRNSLLMNVLASACTAVCFIILIIKNTI